MKALLVAGQRWLSLALLLPILATAGMIVRAELHLHGRQWQFPILGYDPRDMLRGHYLTYRIDWSQGQSTQDPCWDCCVCLKERKSEQTAYRTRCKYATDCDVILAPHDEQALSRFYIPEDKAQRLDRAVRAGQASVILVEKRGRLSLKELLVNGQPWQDFTQTEEEP